MNPPLVASLDHLVLTVADIPRSVAFYAGVLGMTEIRFGEGRTALGFGDQRINLHPAERPFEPHAARPTPGTADLCFVATLPIETIRSRLETAGVAIELGPVPRTGARGSMMSVYVRDPDGNLVEIAAYPA